MDVLLCDYKLQFLLGALYTARLLHHKFFPGLSRCFLHWRVQEIVTLSYQFLGRNDLLKLILEKAGLHYQPSGSAVQAYRPIGRTALDLIPARRATFEARAQECRQALRTKSWIVAARESQILHATMALSLTCAKNTISSAFFFH